MSEDSSCFKYGEESYRSLQSLTISVYRGCNYFIPNEDECKTTADGSEMRCVCNGEGCNNDIDIDFFGKSEEFNFHTDFTG